MNALAGAASDLPLAGAGGPLRSTAAGTVTGADAADPALDLPLAGGGTTFIEASAGTGKTRALTTLVARLVLEEGWPVARILVVTFTRAATAELRDRIRQVLGTLLAAARVRMAEPRSSTDGEAVGPEIDSQARGLLAAWERREGEVDFARAARRLQAAMHDIDRANVLTIHGFCQRVLTDLAFESGFPFGCEAGDDGGETVAGEVRDFWRRRFYPASMLVVRHAFESGFLPDELAGWVSKRRAKVGAELAGVAPPAAPMETCEAAWRAVFDAVRPEWERRRSGFRTEILEGPWLNRQRYRKARSERDLAAFEALFAASEPRLPDADVVGRYGRRQLSQACRKGCTVPANPLFDAFDRLAEASREFRAACDGWLRWTRREALVDVRRSVRRRIRADRRLAYDDLLIELDDALGSAGGQRLAERIRHEFPCALIDEYQDTDPVQARIFTRIYGGARTGSTGPGGARRGESVGAAGPDTDREAAVAGTPGSEGARRGESGGAAGPDTDRGAAVAGTPGSEGARRGESGGAAGPDTDREAAVAGTPGSAQPGRDASSRAETPEPGRPVEDEGSGTSIRSERTLSSRSHPPPHEGSGTSTRGERARSGPFIVVGDPKQSIYRFRGADVFAYLAARRTARERPRLGRNWRSVPALVEAVNAVFAGATPFVVPAIEYRPVAPAMGGDSPLRVQCGESAGPLEFWLLPDTRESRFLTKKEATPVVAGATANEIARFLTLGARGAATIEGRALTGADIAVLVRTREQGRLIAGALRECGVRSIEIDDGSVFHTREAEQLERLLWCVAEPGRESRVRGALAGDLFGLDARALLALGDDERTWSAWTDRLADWRAHRESRGIGALLLRLLEGEGGARQLLRHRDGARRLTNYRHLAELLLAAETRERLSPIELAAWLNHRRTDAAARDDELKLRIESDEQLVRILTVHGSKGLEFPVVFCPFAWDGRSPERRGKSPERRGKVVDAVYHRDARDGYREVVDLDPGEAGQDAEWLEEFSESVRLLYVALTRAKYRCVVAWGQVHGAEHAPLAWLLHRPADATAVAAADQEVAGVHPGGPADASAVVAADQEAPDIHPGGTADTNAVAAADQEVAGVHPGGPADAHAVAAADQGAPDVPPGGPADAHAVAAADREVPDVPPGGPADAHAVVAADQGTPDVHPGGPADANTVVAADQGTPDVHPGGPADANTVVAADQEAPDADPGPAQGDAAVAGDENGVGAAGVDTVVPSLRAVADRFAGLDAPAWLAEIDAFARRHPNAVSTVELDPEPPSAHLPAHHEEPPAALAAREPRRPLRRIRSLTSFTALSAEVRPEGGTFGGSPADRGEAEVDRPDHDQHEEPADAAGGDPVVASAMAGERTAFTFPRGPVAGSCLHRIFEGLDTAPATEADELDLDRICRDALDDFGIDDAWRPVARAMVERTRSVLLREPGPEGADAGRGAGGHADSGRGTDSGAAPGSGEETAKDKGAGSDITAGSGGVASGSRPIGGVAKRPSPGAGFGSDETVAKADPDGTDAGSGLDGMGAGPGSDGTVAKVGPDGTVAGAGPSGTGNAVTAVGTDDAAATEGFRLGDSHRRLVELEFHFPVEGFDRDRLAARMVEHGYPDPFARSGRIGTRESPPLIHGFLRGYIDLVTEHAGRWYILDYKSNWLGPGPGDYGPEALAAAMRAGGYTLQSLIYLVALHRYLSVRLPGYEYERHVGGAFYLFVRGIDPAAGMDRGVHFDRPTAECLLALDDCFRGGGA